MLSKCWFSTDVRISRAEFSDQVSISSEAYAVNERTIRPKTRLVKTSTSVQTWTRHRRMLSLMKWMTHFMTSAARGTTGTGTTCPARPSRPGKTTPSTMSLVRRSMCQHAVPYPSVQKSSRGYDVNNIEVGMFRYTFWHLCISVGSPVSVAYIFSLGEQTPDTHNM